jgi:nucleoside-diphosphate-sugar epimerase
LKNLVRNKKIIGYTGKDSFLAKSFIKKYSENFVFRKYKKDINDLNSFKKWILNNKDINILINFASITSTVKCDKNKSLALRTNSLAPIKMMKIINNLKLKNFTYFLAISSSHVFKKSFKKLNENSVKLPNNYYGTTKLKLENYIKYNRNDFFFRIGIARIFNYYNKTSTKGFFVNDIIRKLRNNNNPIKFKKINTYRDFISIDDISSALFKMIKIKYNNDLNICSGKKTFLPDIINLLNNKIRNKKVIFDKKKKPGLIGSNINLKKIGWKNNLEYNISDEFI